MKRPKTFRFVRLVMANSALIVCILAPVSAFSGPEEPIFLDDFESGEACGWSEVETVEFCDLIDNDCSGVVDDGAFQDNLEPNDSCATAGNLGTIGSDQTWMFTDSTVFPAGDVDVFRLVALETDSTCGCCDPLCFDEDYQLIVQLAVPASAGTYELCMSVGTCDFPAGSCITVLPGQLDGFDLFLDGDCTGEADEYEVFIRVQSVSGPGYSCFPYELTTAFISGVCQ